MRMLQVVPNPYRTLDAEGKPIGVFPCHMKHAPGEYVGATKSLDVIEEAKFVDLKSKSGVRREVAQFDRSKAVFTFSFEPVELPAAGEVGAYYRKGVRQGALLPADKATAQACGVEFESLAKVLEQEREKAALEFMRQFGTLPEWATDTKPAPQSAQK